MWVVLLHVETDEQAIVLTNIVETLKERKKLLNHSLKNIAISLTTSPLYPAQRTIILILSGRTVRKVKIDSDTKRIRQENL